MKINKLENSYLNFQEPKKNRPSPNNSMNSDDYEDQILLRRLCEDSESIENNIQKTIEEKKSKVSNSQSSKKEKRNHKENKKSIFINDFSQIDMKTKQRSTSLIKIKKEWKSKNQLYNSTILKTTNKNTKNLSLVKTPNTDIRMVGILI